jgi:O-acetyl-ADP-ribose deacetylase (regulator of RNase III)
MIQIQQGDITKMAVDAIVNAANAMLAGGGGVDGAIHRAGGPEIMRELDRVRSKVTPLANGDAVTTSAGRLPAKFVFHTAGPVWYGGNSNEPEELARCYRTCLAMADERSCESIAFPAISTGVYGYPKRPAAEIAWREISGHLQGKTTLRAVHIVLFDEESLNIYLQLSNKI